MEPMDMSEDSSLVSLEDTYSTPLCESHTTVSSCIPNVSRKRKLSQEAPVASDMFSQFSSTMNESLMMDGAPFNFNVTDCDATPGCYTDFKKNIPMEAFHSVPTTPIKQIKCDEPVSSPYKEAQKILYPKLKQIGPAIKKSTPQKYGAFKDYSPAKKRLFDNVVIRIDPVMFFRGTYVMSRVFAYLSDSDLFRICKVSSSWWAAVMNDTKASARCKSFAEKYMKNKENYRKTPPGSPPSPDSPPVSPNSKVFHSYAKLAKKLLPGQSLRKCPICDRPSVVEKNISQCQNVHCNYIYCLLCLSFSTTGPEDFVNKCQQSQLVVDKKPSTRFCLSDLSNSATDISTYLSDSSLLNVTSRHDSGFYSEPEKSTPSVRRNLSGSFKILSNHNLNTPSTHRQNNKQKRKNCAPLVSVVGCEYRPQNETEPPSPPKVVAFSKQSKKSLKRLLL